MSNAPDPKFVEFLQWQLRTELRRVETFGAAAGSRTHRKGVRIMAMLGAIVVSMALGAAGSYTVTHVVDEARRELVVTRAEIELDQARARLHQHAETFEELEALAGAGAVGEQELHEERRALLAAEHEVRRRELNIAECRVTGASPNDSLNAPLIEGDDFVTRRLAIDLQQLDVELESRFETMERLEALIGGGVASEAELHDARADLRSIELERSLLQQRISLRADYLDGSLSGRDVELQAMHAQATASRERATSEMERAHSTLKRIEALAEHDRVSHRELRDARLAMREAEARRRLADLELRAVVARMASK